MILKVLMHFKHLTFYPNHILALLIKFILNSDFQVELAPIKSLNIRLKYL
jgi:hypothetical protein